jgi:signal transduction histidine kinase
VRFDDLLDTVLSGDLASSFGAQAAWRQLVDLIGRGRTPADARTLSVLAQIRPSVSVQVRAASARGLIGMQPPFALVRMLATDTLDAAAPLLRELEMASADWIALLPALTPGARAILRHRRDLDHEVARALESFGSVDFVIAGEAGQPRASVETTSQTGPFQSVGAIARALPIVDEAIRRTGETRPETSSLFQIADVVARIEAFHKHQDAHPSTPPAAVPPERMTFETDASGTIRWVEGAPRSAVIGIALAHAARPGDAGVDGVASGAFRKRGRFSNARLIVAGRGEGTGLWLVSAVPVFNRANGRFTGYRGSGRRPRADETPNRRPSADSLRQLMHELRTPTNAIAGFAEMIEHAMLGPVPDVYCAQASAIRVDARGLLAAIDDLDIAARIEGGALLRRPQPVALKPLIGRILDELAPLALTRGATLVPLVADVTIDTDAHALERLIARLAATMLGAGAPGERLTLSLTGTDGGVQLSVDRPAALIDRDEAALLAHDDEGGTGGSLLGLGFALRLVRNLARELGGGLTINEHALTLRLPAMLHEEIGRAQGS